MFNAITAIALTMMNGIFGMVLTKIILSRFGSDFNGLNSTANQLVTILMLLEGGFTIATNVALFKPFSNKDYKSVNEIITGTRKKFRKVGLHAFWISIIMAIVYSFFVNTQLPQLFVIALVLMTLLPASLNLYLAITYRIVLQADQKEYVISTVNFFTLISGYILNILLINLGYGMWIVRFITMLFSVLNSVIICIYVKKHYEFISFNCEANYDAIKGTRHVFVQKATAILYNAAPILTLTVSSSGTKLASVYAIYNSVFVLLKSALYAFIDAPRLGLGDLLSEQKKAHIWAVFKEYQWIVTYMVFLFLTTASVLIMPFITIYTLGIKDVNYNQPKIAILLVLITFFELIHIPSGHLINMSGNFKTAKNIQLIAVACLIMALLIGAAFGILGILMAVFITSIILSVLEMGYVHIKFFQSKIKELLVLVFPLIITFCLVSIIEIVLLPAIDNYLIFIIVGIILVAINAVIGLGVSLLFNKSFAVSFLNRIRSITQKNK